MKRNVVLIIIIVILLAACTPQMSAGETKLTTDASTEMSMAAMTWTPTLIVTEKPTATRRPTLTPSITPTSVPSKTPLTCMTLLTPLDGAEMPAAGRVTFSWNPMHGAGTYVLTIILPSGLEFSFETDQTYRNQYIEAFTPGGDYQWNVTAIGSDRKRTRICSSELASFSKPASAAPPPSDDGESKKK